MDPYDWEEFVGNTDDDDVSRHFNRLNMTEGEARYEGHHEIWGWLHDNGDLD